MSNDEKTAESRSVLDYRNPAPHRPFRPAPAVISAWVFRLALVGFAVYLFGRADSHATRPGYSMTPSAMNGEIAIASDNTSGLTALGFSIGGAAALLAAGLVRCDVRE
jgi:hypothetical protein